MTFIETWAFTGAGVQSTFAWANYNRAAFTDNVKMRQQQKYQQQNYGISWVGVARSDIRGMMGITVNRLNNYMVVGTLIVSIAAAAFYSVQASASCPTFLVYAFYLCMCVSLVFLLLSVVFAVRGQLSAFTNTVRLLTYQTRPENPAEYSHDYLKQSQWIEGRGLSELFRIPGIAPAYGLGDKEASKRTFAGLGPQKPSNAFEAVGDQQGDDPRGAEAPNVEESTPLETLVSAQEHTWYLAKFAEFMRLWLPYEKYSKYCMGLGIVSLGQGTAYFVLGHLSGQDVGAQRIAEDYLLDWAACVVAITFVVLIVVVTSENIRSQDARLQRVVYGLLSIGPIMGGIGGVTEEDWLQNASVLLCFLSHAVFWCLVLLVMSHEFRDGKIESISDGASGFWGHVNKATASKEDLAAKRAWIKQELSKSGEYWPTDDENFDAKAHRADASVRRGVLSTLFVVAAVWLGMAAWACATLAQGEAGSEDQLRRSADAGLRVPVHWPSPLFRPHALAQAEGRTFVADHFRIFELSDGNHLREIPCAHGALITSLSARCTDEVVGEAEPRQRRCWPVALLRAPGDADPRIFDCEAGVLSQLPRREAAATGAGVCAAPAAPTAHARSPREGSAPSCGAATPVGEGRARPSPPLSVPGSRSQVGPRAAPGHARGRRAGRGAPGPESPTGGRPGHAAAALAVLPAGGELALETVVLAFADSQLLRYANRTGVAPPGGWAPEWSSGGPRRPVDPAGPVLSLSARDGRLLVARGAPRGRGGSARPRLEVRDLKTMRVVVSLTAPSRHGELLSAALESAATALLLYSPATSERGSASAVRREPVLIRLALPDLP